MTVSRSRRGTSPWSSARVAAVSASFRTSARKPGACPTSEEMATSDESAARIGTANARATAMESSSRFMDGFPIGSWTRMITNNRANYCRVVHLVHKAEGVKPVALFLSLALAASAHADVFRLLDDDRDAAQARIDLIQQARTEIDAVYFLAHNDRITITALALLRDARRRGVGNVRLIVDANFQHIPRAVLAHLRDEGVEVRVYHELTFRHPSWLFHRMHEKFVVVDGARYIAGGRNLAEEYFGLRKRNFVDRDVYVDGPSAGEAERHFEELWTSGDVSDLRVRVSAGEKVNASRILDEAASGKALGGLVALNTGRNWSDGQKDAQAVRFLHDPLGTDDGPRVADHLADVIPGAKSELVIESQYLVPPK